MTVGTLMTADPVCCTRETTIKDVAMLMAQNDCGEIPVIRAQDDRRLLGVITDRDIVCRVVAEGKNPSAYTVEGCMSQPVVTVPLDAPVEDVLAAMEKHRIRRIPVVDEGGACAGIIAQADVAWAERLSEVGELVREVSRE